MDGKDYCVATVSDNGRGIPDQQKKTLFKRKAEAKTRGSGLGLHLVNTLVESYGGTIRVEDRIPGDHTQGARFVVIIPAAE